MFRRVERLRRDQARQGGFSLVEVVVAVGLLALVLVTLLPELVVGIRATAAAKNSTQAKGVLQGRLETMRSMPYHVGTAGAHADLLDVYYPHKWQSAPQAGGCPQSSEAWVAVAAQWSRYVPDGGVRCDAYEPKSGAFYRTVISDVSDVSFTLVIDTAFLNASDTASPSSEVPLVMVAPKDGYDSQIQGKDEPATWLVGVWTTIVYRSSSGLRPVTTYTQMSAQYPEASS